MPGGTVIHIRVEGDGSAGQVIDRDIAVGRSFRLNAIFLGQRGLEGIIGLLQCVPVRDDGEIDTDFLDGIAAGGGNLASAVAGELTGLGPVSGAPESGLGQFLPESGKRAGHGNPLEGKGRCRCRSRCCRRGRGRDVDGRGLILFSADAQFSLQVLDVERDIIAGRSSAGVLLRAEPAAGPAGIAPAHSAGKGDDASETAGAPSHKQDNDQNGQDRFNELGQRRLIHSRLIISLHKDKKR